MSQHHKPTFRWTPTGAQNSPSKEKVKEFVNKNKKWLMIGGAVLVALLAYHLYTKHMKRSAALVVPTLEDAKKAISGRLRGMGMQVSPSSPSVPATTAPAAPSTATAPSAPVAPVAPAAPVSVKGQLCANPPPKPFNTYQDDLSGANDVTPAVAPFGGNGLVPTDFAGQCTGANPAAVWQSTQLLPGNCGQALEGTSDWDIYAPSNAALTSFIGWQQMSGQDTVLTTNKNASLDLRPEPQVTTGCFQAPWGQSSWVQDAPMKTDWSHSLVA